MTFVDDAFAAHLIADVTALSANTRYMLAGDFNVVPTEADIYSSRSWKTDALLSPQARAAYARLLEAGWTDALRERFPAMASRIATGVSCGRAVTSPSA